MYIHGHQLPEPLEALYRTKLHPRHLPLRPRAGLGLGLIGTPPALGTVARLEYEANRIAQNSTEAQRWGVPGSLPADGLEIRRFMASTEWAPRTPFRTASFQNFNKCNIFALDMAWRCGFHVPLLRINFGSSSSPNYRYSFPLANSLTTYAERAFNRGASELAATDGTRWGWVETSRPAAAINDYIDQGWVYILVGWRRSGTGHVGLIRRIVNKHNDTGRVQEITYDGWEATSTRAEELTGRRWRTTQCGSLLTGQCQSNPTGNLLHVFCAIHIICLDWEPDPASRGLQVEFRDRCRLS